MKDALIAGSVNQDIRDALLGWAQTGSGRFYGAKEMVRHWKIERLVEAIESAKWPVDVHTLIRAYVLRNE
jgi:hypothetical protein